MFRYFFALALCATPALADRDHIEIIEHGTAEALVIYHNAADMASDNGTTTVQIEVAGVLIVVDVTIAVNAGDLGQHELATVTPRGGYIAIPDQLSVADGASGEFRVMLPMF
jgi:hypothetical protein